MLLTPCIVELIPIIVNTAPHFHLYSQPAEVVFNAFFFRALSKSRSHFTDKELQTHRGHQEISLQHHIKIALYKNWSKKVFKSFSVHEIMLTWFSY